MESSLQRSAENPKIEHSEVRERLRLFVENRMNERSRTELRKQLVLWANNLKKERSELRKAMKRKQVPS